MTSASLVDTSAHAISTTARLFVALWPSTELARDLRARCNGRTEGSRAHWVAVPKLHVTLHFLGDVPRPRLAELGPALQVPFQPFELSFSRFELWPRGLLVALPDAVPQALSELHAALGQALRNVGLPTDTRTFTPHITLARRHAGPLATQAGSPLHWPVRDYVLVESQTAHHGAYRVLQHYR
jgi:RNA 2',3'-cyclic 3'-phosphodiesterase